uniref:NmrA domain-containing protein n=1 Tax=Macrostomum lignano TaxID=282301 RepID=A0A1I8FHJ4_9PLAT
MIPCRHPLLRLCCSRRPVAAPLVVTQRASQPAFPPGNRPESHAPCRLFRWTRRLGYRRRYRLRQRLSNCVKPPWGFPGRKPGPLDSAAKEINQATGKPVAALPCDVRDANAVEAGPGQLRETTGRAAKSGCEQCPRAIFPTERLSANAFRTVVDIVLLGTANVTMATAKRLIKAQQGGSFLSVTTVYAETGSPFVVPSACAKGLAKEAMTKSLAAEGAFSRLDPTGEFIAHAVKRIPAGRLGEIEEFSNLGVYLLSDYASWINGSSAGEFSPLLRITGEQWDAMEKMIRSVKGS